MHSLLSQKILDIIWWEKVFDILISKNSILFLVYYLDLCFDLLFFLLFFPFQVLIAFAVFFFPLSIFYLGHYHFKSSYVLRIAFVYKTFYLNFWLAFKCKNQKFLSFLYQILFTYFLRTHIHVCPWRIHVDVWQNQYSIVK